MAWLSQIHVTIFARAPVAGRCKTRLAQTLGAPRAAEFAARSLDALIERLQPAGIRWSLSPASVTDALWFERHGYGLCLGETQATGDLGRRMVRAHREACAEGAAISAVIGSDCPDAPLETVLGRLREALPMAEDQPLSWLCPTADGGYWCWAVGRAVLPRLHDELASVAWSSGRELAQSCAQLEDWGVIVEQLGAGYDVDTYEDLVALIARLEKATSQAASRREVPPWQRRLLLALHDMWGTA